MKIIHVAKLKRCGGVEKKEERRHPCVLDLIRFPIEGYKLHLRGRVKGRERERE